jgi:hypothetical protein
MSAYWLLAAAADAEDESAEGGAAEGGQASEAAAARDSSGARGGHLEGRAKVAQRYDFHVHTHCTRDYRWIQSRKVMF